MNLTLILVIGLVLVVIIVVMLSVNKKYTPAVLPPISPETEKTALTPPSPWGWPRTDSSGKIIVDSTGQEVWDSYTFIKNSTEEGKCGIYTVPPSGDYTPGLGSISYLKGGITLSRVDASGGCIDDDQFFAQKAKHKCRGDLNLSTRTSGECRGDSGDIFLKDAVEEFWMNCDPTISTGSIINPGGKTSRCEGGIGLIAFHTQHTLGEAIFTGARCLISPQSYNVKEQEGKIQIDVGDCKMTQLDDYNLSRTLFRVQRAIYSPTGFISSNSGNFIRIIHRKTGLCVAPVSNTLNATLTLVKPGKQITVGGKSFNLNGYWWFLLPGGNNPLHPLETFVQSIVYAPDPLPLSKLNTPLSVFQFISTGPLVICAEGAAHLEKLRAPGFGELYEEAQYYDASLLPLLLTHSFSELAFSL